MRILPAAVGSESDSCKTVRVIFRYTNSFVRYADWKSVIVEGKSKFVYAFIADRGDNIIGVMFLSALNFWLVVTDHDSVSTDFHREHDNIIITVGSYVLSRRAV